MHRRTIMAVPVALLLAACGGDREPDGNARAPDGFVPPATQAPTPLAGQRQTTPLTAYVGRYPQDAVDGVSFFDRTEVANALIQVVPGEKERRAIVGRDGVTTPIFARGAQVASQGCEPHNCGDHNWTVMIATDGNIDRATVCYHDAATMGDASRWTTRAGATRRAGACPSA